MPQCQYGPLVGGLAPRVYFIINTAVFVILIGLLCAAAASIIVLSYRAARVSHSLQQARSDCRETEAKLRELSELGRKQEEQLEHSTRLAELGEMAAAISHELNQPLTGIRNYARNAFYMIEKKAGTEEDVKGNLRLISDQVDRAARIINEMRELTRRSENVFTTLDVNGVLRECLEFLVPQMKLADVESLSPLQPSCLPSGETGSGWPRSSSTCSRTRARPWTGWHAGASPLPAAGTASPGCRW